VHDSTVPLPLVDLDIFQFHQEKRNKTTWKKPLRRIHFGIVPSGQANALCLENIAQE
jgi:hypothetical protein